MFLPHYLLNSSKKLDLEIILSSYKTLRIDQWYGAEANNFGLKFKVPELKLYFRAAPISETLFINQNNLVLKVILCHYFSSYKIVKNCKKLPYPYGTSFIHKKGLITCVLVLL